MTETEKVQKAITAQKKRDRLIQESSDARKADAMEKQKSMGLPSGSSSSETEKVQKAIAAQKKKSRLSRASYDAKTAVANEKRKSMGLPYGYNVSSLKTKRTKMTGGMAEYIKPSKPIVKKNVLGDRMRQNSKIKSPDAKTTAKPKVSSGPSKSKNTRTFKGDSDSSVNTVSRSALSVAKPKVAGVSAKPASRVYTDTEQKILKQLQRKDSNGIINPSAQLEIKSIKDKARNRARKTARKTARANFKSVKQSLKRKNDK